MTVTRETSTTATKVRLPTGTTTLVSTGCGTVFFRGQLRLKNKSVHVVADWTNIHIYKAIVL